MTAQGRDPNPRDRIFLRRYHYHFNGVMRYGGLMQLRHSILRLVEKVADEEGDQYHAEVHLKPEEGFRIVSGPGPEGGITLRVEMIKPGQAVAESGQAEA